MKAKVPDGISFDCNGAAASVTFNDHGYLPDSSALHRARDGSLSQQPRSTATLKLGDVTHPLVAEWAELGLRYRAVSAGPDGRTLILSLRGEDATIGWRAAADRADPAGEQLTHCRRAGRNPAIVSDEESH